MIRKLMLMLCALTLTAACAAADTITDMHGRTIDLAEPATRVVALTAADCEILCALGAQDTLVGRGEYCNYPEDILDRPVVQSGANTNVEEILALQPQVLLPNLVGGLIGGGVVFLLLWLCGRLSHGGVGGGDVKLMAALTCLLGLYGGFNVLLFAQFSALAVVAVLLVLRRITLKGSIPFAPFF